VNASRAGQVPLLHVRAEVLDEIERHARGEFPYECCGLLIGTGERLEHAVRARNDRRSPTRYLVRPEDHFAAIRLARQMRLAVLGAYHSHPGAPPVPSTADRADAQGAGFLYLIAALDGADSRATCAVWRLDGGNFVEVPFVRLA
jgi:proteasome lid subunit RPN8/RPN11